MADCRSSGMSVTRWCAEHNVKPKTYYNWQKKVFAAMLAQQKVETSDAPPRFAELPAPPGETKLAAAEKQTDLVASVRIGDASLEVYGGASAEIVSALFIYDVLQEACFLCYGVSNGARLAAIFSSSLTSSRSSPQHLK